MIIPCTEYFKLIILWIDHGHQNKRIYNPQAKNNDQFVNQSKSAETWSIVCASLTFAINVIVVIMHLNAVTSLLIVGTKLEGSLATILVAFWAATVAIVSDSSKGLAVDEIGAVVNGNLYYFSWYVDEISSLSYCCIFFVGFRLELFIHTDLTFQIN